MYASALLAQNGIDVGSLLGPEIAILMLAVVGGVVWLYALIHAIRNPALDSTMRIIWVLVILFASLLGAIVYLIVGRNPTSQNPV